ncbi:MAG: TerB family tellurite resistance protein [Bacteroidota bacterium]|nr:TerB family tellurite resistance protein [Bacteroidota bacterium]
MGLFGDIFKANSDWTFTELQAIFVTMAAMGCVDGELDKDEAMISGEMLIRLPGSGSISNWKDFAEGAMKMKPEVAFSTLKGMHSKKREVAVTMLYGVAQADGNVDDKEAQFFMNVANALNVRIPS